jgi:excisionase family DNA binding protein
MKTDLAQLQTSIRAARAADRLRGALIDAAAGDRVSVAIGSARVEVPTVALEVFLDVLDDLAEGRAVTVAPADVPIGTTEAARLLGMSRPSVTRLVDDGQLPGEVIGTKRRIPLGALVARRRERAAALRAAAAAIADSEPRAVDTDPRTDTEADGIQVASAHVVHTPLSSISDTPTLAHRYALGYGLAA